MARVRVAAVQASYVLMDQQATLDRVAELTAKAAAQGAQLVVFPEVFVPGTPIWIDTQPIWDGDDDWFRLLAENAVVVPGPATERLAGLARDHGLWLVIGVEERWICGWRPPWRRGTGGLPPCATSRGRTGCSCGLPAP